MDGSLLLIGKETFIGSKLAERLTLEGKQVVSFGSENSKTHQIVLWSRLSYISTKTAMRELERHYSRLNEIYIVFGRKRDETADSSSNLIDEVVDGELKSLIYLSQELHKRLAHSELEPSLFFIADNLYDKKSPISSAAGLAFKTYIEALMERNTDCYMAGFELEGEDSEGFLNYVLKNSLARNPKKRNTWSSYPKGLKLFGG